MMEKEADLSPGSVNPALLRAVQDAPHQSGVYLMFSSQDTLLYVGKAKDLKNRLRSYWHPPERSPRLQYLTRQVKKVEWILTKNEFEALLLEAQLIKKHQPRYNVRLKDDKAFPYLKIELGKSWPRLTLSRRLLNDGARYFGPYPRQRDLELIQDLIHRLYGLRSCSDQTMLHRKRPCLEYDLGKCSAPCVGMIESEAYLNNVQKAVSFLNGDVHPETLNELESLMWKLAQAEQFEAAAFVRDQWQVLKRFLEDRQKTSQVVHSFRMDVVLSERVANGWAIGLYFIRQERLVGQRFGLIPVEEWEPVNRSDVVLSFLAQYYMENLIPEVLAWDLDLSADLLGLWQQYLSHQAGYPVQVRPLASHDLAQNESLWRQELQDWAARNPQDYQWIGYGLQEIQRVFQIPRWPHRIEVYDISHFRTLAVASLVVFEEGQPNPALYRRFRLSKAVWGNDIASLEETLTRRLKHQEWPLPQLMVIDGGRAQLQVVEKLVQEYVQNQNLGEKPVIVGLAKARRRYGSDGQRQVLPERFWLPGADHPIVLHTSSPALRILVQARNEAHRFAKSYQEKLRQKETFRSLLEDIPGLGVVRIRKLWEKFSTWQQLAQLNEEQLSDLLKVSREQAQQIRELLRKKIERINRTGFDP